MRCADVMSTDVAIVHGEDEVGVANRIMQKRDIPFLPVCDATGRVIGFVTHRHIAYVAITDDVGPSTPVKDVMGRDVFTCSPEDDVSVAERALLEHPWQCAVCVGPNGEPVGIVGITDLALAGRAPGRPP